MRLSFCVSWRHVTIDRLSPLTEAQRMTNACRVKQVSETALRVLHALCYFCAHKGDIFAQWVKEIRHDRCETSRPKFSPRGPDGAAALTSGRRACAVRSGVACSVRRHFRRRCGASDAASLNNVPLKCFPFTTDAEIVTHVASAE